MPTPSSRRSRNAPLKLNPDTVLAVRARAERLHLTVSGYVAILVWNQGLSREAFDTIDQSEPRLIRVELALSLRGKASALALKGARAAKLPVNRYLAALIARDLAHPRAPLVILCHE